MNQRMLMFRSLGYIEWAQDVSWRDGPSFSEFSLVCFSVGFVAVV